MKIGDNVMLQSYKHDKSLHRVWKNEVILKENEEMIIVANKRTRVVEANGRFWYTKEPSVSFFFKKHWFNVIGIIKKDHIGYYCNIASPILYDEEALKYIDYDLDVKVNKDNKYHILDVHEYERNQEIMNYSEEIKHILVSEMDLLIAMIKKKEFPFEQSDVHEWYHKLLSLEEEEY
ncbi:MAG: DUF402 domain-containing protein [Tenericutes bacterium]|nr:DUF402 domain-containing protein [Mycoplasmatota bacterium]